MKTITTLTLAASIAISAPSMAATAFEFVGVELLKTQPKETVVAALDEWKKAELEPSALATRASRINDRVPSNERTNQAIRNINDEYENAITVLTQ
jgi:hypothetical protein